MGPAGHPRVRAIVLTCSGACSNSITDQTPYCNIQVSGDLDKTDKIQDTTVIYLLYRTHRTVAVTTQCPCAKSNAPCPQWPWLGPSSAPGASPREEMAVSQWSSGRVIVLSLWGWDTGAWWAQSWADPRSWVLLGRSRGSDTTALSCPCCAVEGPHRGTAGSVLTEPAAEPLTSCWFLTQSCRHAGRRGEGFPPSSPGAPGTGFCRGTRAQGAAAVSGRCGVRWLSFEGSSGRELRRKP